VLFLPGHAHAVAAEQNDMPGLLFSRSNAIIPIVQSMTLAEAIVLLSFRTARRPTPYSDSITFRHANRSITEA